ncbi:MAG: chromosome segregation ATPase [Kiritimatiellia bacterium]|jgi:chromosome segregation ATPase
MSNETVQWEDRPQDDQLASMESELDDLKAQLATAIQAKHRAVAQRAGIAAQLDDSRDALRQTRAALKRVRSTARKLSPRKPKKAATLSDPRKALPQEERDILASLALLYGQSPMLVMRRLIRERQADLRMKRDH